MHSVVGVTALVIIGIIFCIHKKQYGLFVFLCLVFFMGFTRAQWTNHAPKPTDIDHYNFLEKEVTLQGKVCAEPDRRSVMQKITVCVNKLIKPSEKNLEGKILINAPKYPLLEYDDKLEIIGLIEEPGQIDSFSYKDYLALSGIHSVMYRPKKINILQSSKAGVGKNLFAGKSAFEETVNKVFPEPFGAFLAGLLLGSRKGLPEKITEELNTTGLTHIIAISGYNITILITIIMALLRPYGKKLAIISSGMVIILFTVIVGMSAAVVRACIMGIISLIALQVGRSTYIHITLLLTLCTMVMVNPLILFHDIGFQLSFLATGGLVYVSPLFHTISKRIPSYLGLRESFILSISAQIATAPIIMMNFERISLVAPLSNILIAGPIIPFAMLFGFAGSCMGFISVLLGKIVGFIAYILMSYILLVVEITAKIPHSSMDVNWFNNILVLSYYVALIWLIYKLHRKSVIQKNAFID
jgi:competence protein ComEC